MACPRLKRPRLTPISSNSSNPESKEKIMILRIFTIIHVLISLLGIASGFVVLYGMHTANAMNGWSAFFLNTTAATSIIGFFLPFKRLLPSQIVGIMSVVVMAPIIYARYHTDLTGSYR